MVGFIASATVTGTSVSQAAEKKVATNIDLKKYEKHGRVMMPTVRTLSLNGIIQWQRNIVRHDHWVLKTAKSHPKELVKWHRAQLRWTLRELKNSLSIWYSRYHAIWPSLGLSSWPPHHNLWVCISKYEGSPTSVNPNGHYGMLQMTYNWFKVIKGRASDYSQLVQEWAAEQVYVAHHSYSSRVAFLWGQWFDYDAAEGECLRYA